LKKFKISEKDSSTSAINLSPEYDFIDGVQILKGQRASQSLDVTIRNLTAPNEIGKLIT